MALFSSLRFDRQDYEFLAMINRSLDPQRDDKAVLFPSLHPNGIVELSSPTEMRMALAVLHLLDSLKQGEEEDRLQGLQALRDEVLASARTSLRYNTGRVLIQIMKEIVRAHGDAARQIRLAHDFRQAATGKPSVVRRMLRRYYLLEMPEEWNQAVFDHHVHDANTKGRKNATHLIMDAWIKGIRSLTVIYYNYVTLEAARELTRAAEIMGVHLRIGLLFHAPFRGRLIDFIWIPRGFADAEGFLNFLAEPPMRHLMNAGRQATQWLEGRVLRMLDHWNSHGRQELAEEIRQPIPPLEPAAFIAFVGAGQASLIHLAECIHRHIFPALKAGAAELQAAMRPLDEHGPEYFALHERLARLDALTGETLLERLNNPARNPDLEVFRHAPTDPDCPEILRLAPLVLLDWLTSLHTGNRVILNLADLTPDDALNLLWDCQGLITHLEIFNLKDWQEGKAAHIQTINDIQRAINDHSAPRLKQIIRGLIRDCEDAAPAPGPEARDETDDAQAAPKDDSPSGAVVGAASSGAPSCEERAERLHVILRNIPHLLEFYKKTKLQARMGTDSTSRPGRRYGMGLAYPETLPSRARKEVRENVHASRLRLPLRTELHERITFRSGTDEEAASRFTRLIRRLPGCRHFRKFRQREWIPVQEHTLVCNSGACGTDMNPHAANQGNVVTLGGMGRASANGFLPETAVRDAHPDKERYINTRLANTLKVLAGFIPAMITFQITQEGWWFLAWLGAPLWFLITGLRNIVQAVLGGGGLRRSPLLRWNNYVSWSRLCDSLMYTGFSVVLLELLVRRWLLTDTLNIHADTSALLTFSVISIINGLYIAGHNYLRGLQREAIIANLFRSVFAIPVALVYNVLFAALLALMNVADAAPLLASCAAIISKIASDTVAGVIEGIADRNSNVRLRILDYANKLQQMFNVYARLETVYPDQGVVEMLAEPHEMLAELDKTNRDLRIALIINALDMMYFWFYQPRALYVLTRRLQRLSGVERLVLWRSQCVLACEREVSQMLVDGLVGNSFARPLSFYLDRHAEYLRDMERLCMNGHSGAA